MKENHNFIILNIFSISIKQLMHQPKLIEQDIFLACDEQLFSE